METRLPSSNLVVLASCAILAAGLSFPWHYLSESFNQAASAHAISETKHVVATTEKVKKPQANQKYLCVARKLMKATHHEHSRRARIANHPVKTL